MGNKAAKTKLDKEQTNSKVSTSPRISIEIMTKEEEEEELPAPGQEQWEGNLSFNNLLDNEMEFMKQVDLSLISNALKIIDNELWSCQIDGIAVYDEELKLLRTMSRHGGRAIVYSAVLLSHDRVIVAGADLYISKQSGEFIRTISEGTYFDLALCNGHLYATHLDSPTIHVYDCRTWHRMQSISTPCSKTMHGRTEHWHRICVSTNEIKISCFDLDSFYIIDTHGKLKQTHGPSTTIITASCSETEGEHVIDDNQLREPMICQEDEDGAVLVADEWNFRLLILTAAGQWRTVRINESWLPNPRDAVFWRGLLYVTTCDYNDRLAMFNKCPIDS